MTLDRKTVVNAIFGRPGDPTPEPNISDLCNPNPPDPDSNEPIEMVTLRFIDVGQGDAILIQGTNGQNVLYDGATAMPMP